MKTLIRIRDKDKKSLLSGNGSFENFHDSSAINHGLGEDEDTLNLFLILDKKYPEQSKPYYIVAEDLLIRHKKYDICAKYIKDPIMKYEELRHNRKLRLSSAKTNPQLNNPSFLEYADQTYVDSVVKLIDILIAIDKHNNAIEIQK